MGSPGQPASNNSSWVIVLIVIGFSFATGYLIGFLAKDVAFTDHEAALHEAAGLTPAGATGGATDGGSLSQLLLPKGKKWPGVWAWRHIRGPGGTSSSSTLGLAAALLCDREAQSCGRA